MLESNKHVFWEALIIAVFIFGLGVLLGVFIENSRASTISDMYMKSEIDLLDVKLQTEVLNLWDIDCENALKQNIDFGNRIYEEAKTLGRFEAASRITNSLVEQHKRYDLLRTIFWINSIKIKDACGQTFHTIVYLYNYNTDSFDEKNLKTVFSNHLSELKKEYGNKIVLIPIARDLNLTSVDMLLNNYRISEKSSIILVDENLVVSTAEDLPKIKAYLDSPDVKTAENSSIPIDESSLSNTNSSQD